MNRMTQYVCAGVLGLIGLTAIGGALSTDGSVREYIDDEYTLIKSTDPAFKGARVYTSPRIATDVAEDIAKQWKPAERHVDPAGHFLRYRNDFVVVSPTETGSRIVVDEQDRGYVRWYPYIGGYWGTYSAPGEDFRGGGPGAGK